MWKTQKKVTVYLIFALEEDCLNQIGSAWRRQMRKKLYASLPFHINLKLPILCKLPNIFAMCFSKSNTTGILKFSSSCSVVLDCWQNFWTCKWAGSYQPTNLKYMWNDIYQISMFELFWNKPEYILQLYISRAETHIDCIV